MSGVLNKEESTRSIVRSFRSSSHAPSFKPKKVVCEDGKIKYHEMKKDGKINPKASKVFDLKDCNISQTTEQVKSNSFKVTVKAGKGTKKEYSMVFKCKSEAELKQWVSQTKIATGQEKPAPPPVEKPASAPAPAPASAPAPVPKPEPPKEKVHVHEHGNHPKHSRRPSLEVESMKVVVVEAPTKKPAHSFKPTTTTTQKRRNSLNKPAVNVIKHEHDEKKGGIVVTMHNIEEKFWFCVPVPCLK